MDVSVRGFNNSSLNLNWFPLARQYCENGWKLVEVFLDQRTQMTVQGHMVNQHQVVNSEILFIFEKEESKINNNTAVYEVTVKEFGAKIKNKLDFVGASIELSCKWEETIANMGKEGWEIVRILFTPLIRLVPSSYMRQEQTLLMFFQRQIMPPPNVEQIGGSGKVDIPQKENEEFIHNQGQDSDETKDEGPDLIQGHDPVQYPGEGHHSQEVPSVPPPPYPGY